MGDTLYTMPYSVSDYHMKFLREVCGEDFVVTYEELVQAEDKAEIALYELLDEVATGPNHEINHEEWLYFDRVLLQSLGVDADIDKKSLEYQRLWNDLLTSHPNTLRLGAKEVLEDLYHRGLKLGVATNWTQSPDDLLSSSGIRHLFQSLQWTLIRGYAKPSPYMLIMNAHELGVNPIRCAFVGNKINLDVEAARRAGMQPILLSKLKEELQSENEDVLIIKDLVELLDYLE